MITGHLRPNFRCENNIKMDASDIDYDDERDQQQKTETRGNISERKRMLETLEERQKKRQK